MDFAKGFQWGVWVRSMIYHWKSYPEAICALAGYMSLSWEEKYHILEADSRKERLELMEQAETMADLLEIESRLTDVRYELENRASQLRLYDNQVDYATIYLSIDEVQEYTPVEEPTVWERISGGFVSSIKGVGNGLLDLLVWVLAKSPYLVILGGVTAGVVVLIKKRKTRRAAKKAAKQNPTEESK